MLAHNYLFAKANIKLVAVGDIARDKSKKLLKTCNKDDKKLLYYYSIDKTI